MWIWVCCSSLEPCTPTYQSQAKATKPKSFNYWQHKPHPFPHYSVCDCIAVHACVDTYIDMEDTPVPAAEVLIDLKGMICQVRSFNIYKTSYCLKVALFHTHRSLILLGPGVPKNFVCI